MVVHPREFRGGIRVHRLNRERRERQKQIPEIATPDCYNRFTSMGAMAFKEAMGVLSVILMFVAYGIYIWQTMREDGVRPHPFSWFLWGFVTGVVYLVQVSQGAGAGSWVVGFTAIICFLIGSISFFKEKWRFSFFDWFCLSAGLAVFIFYLLSKNPIQSAILATTTDVIGYGSTIKKGWAHPHKDSVSSFSLNSAKFVPSLFALQAYSMTTWLYPATLVIMNAGVAIMLVARRRQLNAAPLARTQCGA